MKSNGATLEKQDMHNFPLENGNEHGSKYRSKRAKFPLTEIAVLAGLTVAVRLPWIFMTPISQAPDEGAHYWVIDFIRTNLRLPELSDMTKEPNSAYYGALMPLSYFPHVACAFLMPWFHPALAYRFGSLMMAIVSVLAARGVGKELFPHSKLVAAAVPLYFIFHAQLAFVNGYSNNDSTSTAVSTVALYASLWAVRRGITFKSAIAFGIVGGCLALSKPTTYCIVPVLFIALAMSAYFHRDSFKNNVKKLAAMFSIASIIALPFYIRNWIQFNGDLLGMRTMLDLWWQHYGKPAQLYRWPVIDNSDWRYCAFISYIGNLGNMDKLLPSRIYKLFSLAINLSLTGWALSLVLAFVGKQFPLALHKVRTTIKSIVPDFAEKPSSIDDAAMKEGFARNEVPARGEDAVRGASAARNDSSAMNDNTAKDDNAIAVTLWVLMCIAFLLNFVALVAGSASLNATGPPQGRYLFPCEAAIAALIVGGLSRLHRSLVVLFIALNVVATVISLTMLYPIYHFDTNIFR